MAAPRQLASQVGAVREALFSVSAFILNMISLTAGALVFVSPTSTCIQRPRLGEPAASRADLDAPMTRSSRLRGQTDGKWPLTSDNDPNVTTG